MDKNIYLLNTNNLPANLDIKKEINFSANFTELLINSVGGYISPERFELFLKKLKNEVSKFVFDAETEANLIRVTDSLFDKVSFINEALKYPHHLEILTAIVSNSNFLTDIIVQNPGFLYQIYDNEYLNQADTATSFKEEIASGMAPYKSFNSRLNYLKQFKKRYILKTGIKDILGYGSLTETTSALSSLAYALLSSLFEICITGIEEKYKTGISRSYCLASLGKQGGNELNYSSDVDLILFYEKNYVPEGTANREYFELLNEAILLFIKSASEISEKGYLYRIDFRLRPDGRHSPLCRTMNDYMNYYEARGENWERQMLIKLGFIGGSRDLYDSFYKYIRGFIFPSYYTSPIKEQVRRIKDEIERKIGEAENVKLFPGGIRDIEFAVQVLQLLNGGKIKELRNGNTLESIELLRQHDLLSSKEADTFKEAYIFYRKIEHFLQLMNDRQTHLIPEKNELRIKLARHLKLKDKNELDSTIEKYRSRVRKIFKHILKPDASGEKENLTGISFKDKARAVKNIKFLQSGSGITGSKEFELRTMEDFKIIEGGLLKHLTDSDEPDKVLENFSKILKSAPIPSLWYSQLKGKNFLKSFLDICRRSQIAVDLISSGRQTGDYFLSGGCFRFSGNGPAEKENFNELILTLSVQYAMGKLKEKDFSHIISDAIDVRITAHAEKFQHDYFIAALGSYGNREMNFASDIDFLFVPGDNSDVYKAEKEYEGMIKTINREIGFFNIDLRLRPEGKNSQLARTISSYEKYFKDRARIWEFQSLTKLRFVCGSKKMFNLFSRKLISRIELIDRQALRNEITGMHNSYTRQSALLDSDMTDMKKSKGGFATIEFALQYLLLANPQILKKCFGKPITFCVDKFKENSNFKGEMESFLINYRSMKKILIKNQNLTGAKNYKLPAESSDAMELKEMFKQNLNIFNKILEN